MRIPSALVLVFSALEGALAHTLGDNAVLTEELSHQLVGLHHIPLLLLLVVAGTIVLRKVRRNRSQ